MNGEGKAFFDTNVLLYMYGGADLKQVQAKKLFNRYARSNRLLLSTQVVQEFYSAGSRKLNIPRDVLKDIAVALMELPLVTIGPRHILAAIDKEERHISFWDALIMAAAESGGAEVLFTEDLNDGQIYDSVVVRNPFTDRDTPQA